MTCKSYDIPKTVIWEAWLRVKANKGAAGIDAETIGRFEDEAWRQPVQTLESHEFRLLFSAAGEGCADSEEIGRRPSLGHPDTAGIMHLI